MSLEKLQRARAEAIKCVERQDLEGAVRSIVAAGKMSVTLAARTRDAAWQRHLLDVYEECAALAHQIRGRLDAQPDPEVKRPRPSSHSAAAAQPAANDLKANAKDWRLAERPKLKLGDVAGMDELKALVQRQVIEPLRHPEIYDAYRLPRGFGVLLYGPPGTGKTYFARALAGELDCAFFVLDGAEIVTKWVGDPEKNLKSLMEQAAAERRSVVFIDEIDGMFPRRGSGSTFSDRWVSQFLHLLDGLQPKENWMLVIGGTNHPRRIDPALLRSGRIGRHIYVGMPDAAARKAILDLELSGVPTAGPIETEALAADMDGYSAADTAAMASEAKEIAAHRDATGASGETPEVRGITMDDFQVALRTVHPMRVDPAMMRDLEQFRAEHGSD